MELECKGGLFCRVPGQTRAVIVTPEPGGGGFAAELASAMLVIL
jgi:hypothetical protein